MNTLETPSLIALQEHAENLLSAIYEEYDNIPVSLRSLMGRSLSSLDRSMRNLNYKMPLNDSITMVPKCTKAWGPYNLKIVALIDKYMEAASSVKSAVAQNEVPIVEIMVVQRMLRNRVSQVLESLKLRDVNYAYEIRRKDNPEANKRRHINTMKDQIHTMMNRVLKLLTQLIEAGVLSESDNNSLKCGFEKVLAQKTDVLFFLELVKFTPEISNLLPDNNDNKKVVECLSYAIITLKNSGEPSSELVCTVKENIEALLIHLTSKTQLQAE